MLEVLIGASAGLAVAATGLFFYRLGVKEGRGKRQSGEDAATAEGQSTLMKKYEAILDYDPYGERV